VHISRTLSTCGLAAAIAFSPAIGRAAETSQPNAASSSTAARIGIDNFGQINANYYRGAQPDADDYADLAALGVKTVIDLQQDGRASEERFVKAAGMKFYRIPMTVHVPPTGEELASFLRIVNDPANQPVYVHCAGGRHRTGVMTAVYRMTRDGWTADQAFKEMKRYDYGPDFLHPEFKKFVYGYRAEPVRAASVQAVAATNAPKSQPEPVLATQVTLPPAAEAGQAARQP
jgi:tyrosine-protein phosphatase SIW14